MTSSTALETYVNRLRARVRTRAREGRCLLCGATVRRRIENICSNCRPPNSPSVVALATNMGLLRRCRTCWLTVAHMDLHLYVCGGRDGHPPPAGPVPSSARWILEALFTSGGVPA